MKQHRKIAVAVNAVLAAAVLVGNYFYMTEGGLPIKAVTSSLFAAMGIFNLIYAYVTRTVRPKFHIAMATGLVFACLGDIVLNVEFVVGAALFAIGHICYFVAYCMLSRLRRSDLVIGGVIFLGAGAFVLFSPWLTFPSAILRPICAVYALIISLMVGKAIASFIRERNVVTAVILIGSILFFFSDLMLVFDQFMDVGRIAGVLCLATYYPAECLLAFSAYLATLSKGRVQRS